MASELASLVQSTHIQHSPSAAHDVNPSTAASAKVPAEIVPSEHEEVEPEDPLETNSASSETSTLPSDIVRPVPRQPPTRHHLPLPDLRFEQTYLASIKNATSTT